MDKNKKTEKNIINIETITDLHKIPLNIIKTKKLYEFKGKYFEQIYKEALEQEKKESEKKPALKFVYCKSPKKDKTENILENKAISKNKIHKDLSNKKENNNTHTNKNFEDNDELRKSNKKNSLEINIFDDQLDIVGRLRTNSCHIPARKKKEFKIKKITFQIDYDTKMGEEVGLIGSIKELGSWDKNKIIRMYWNDGNIWKTTIDVSFIDISSFEFKFILIDKGDIKEWENGNNRIFKHNKFKKIIEKNINKNKNIYEKDYDYIVNEGTLILKCNWNKK